MYKPNDAKISLMTGSYGGRYGPAFMDYFLTQNAKIETGSIDGTLAHRLEVGTLGIFNGRSPIRCAIVHAGSLLIPYRLH